MRIAASVLTLIAALASLWLFAVAEMLIRPGAGDTVLRDDYYAVAHARAYIPLVLLALFNGSLTLAVWARPRRWGLWLVLAAGFLALAIAGWDNVALRVPEGRIPATTFFDASGGGDSTDWMGRITQWLALRHWLVWAVLALTVAGWAAWLLARLRRPAAGQA
jgi:hypothetical protein